jgi:hypothetical protein
MKKQSEGYGFPEKGCTVIRQVTDIHGDMLITGEASA